jgi:hypothetical protein
MKRTELISRVGRTSLIALLTAAVDVRAQSLNFKPLPASRAATVPFAGDNRGAGIDRVAEVEWIRGYRDGYELGYGAGVQDARSVLPPGSRVPGYNAHTKMTPYRKGYFAGYAEGYRQASGRMYWVRS